MIEEGATRVEVNQQINVGSIMFLAPRHGAHEPEIRSAVASRDLLDGALVEFERPGQRPGSRARRHAVHRGNTTTNPLGRPFPPIRYVAARAESTDLQPSRLFRTADDLQSHAEVVRERPHQRLGQIRPPHGTTDPPFA